MDIPRNQHVQETDLESVLIDSLEEFLLELGRGFSFVKRQRRLSEDGEDWWVDLVFYNFYLRRFVLFDLKTGKLDPRDVGQMDFYLSFFDDKYKLPDDDPSIGILLCSEKDEVVARCSGATAPSSRSAWSGSCRRCRTNLGVRAGCCPNLMELTSDGGAGWTSTESRTS